MVHPKSEERSKQALTTSIGNKPFLTLEEAADFLGFSKSHLYKLTSKRLIPFYQPSRKILFLSTELESWIYQSKRLTLQDVEVDSSTLKLNND